MPSGFQAPAASRDLSSAGVTGNSASAGMPSSTHLAASSSSKSMVRRSTPGIDRSEEHTSELQSLMRISYAVFCLKKKKKINKTKTILTLMHATYSIKHNKQRV